MTTFDDRDKAFENKFAHEEELNFKATAIANRMIGLWAAEKMGKKASDTEAYAIAIVEAEFAEKGHSGIESKLLEDFSAAGVEITAKEIQKEMSRLLPIARQQVMGNK